MLKHWPPIPTVFSSFSLAFQRDLLIIPVLLYFESREMHIPGICNVSKDDLGLK